MQECRTTKLRTSQMHENSSGRPWTDWDKKYYGAKKGTLLDTPAAGGQKWLDDVKGTPEDPDAVRCRLVATQVNTCAREDVTQSTSPFKASRIIVSGAATKTNAKGQRDCLFAAKCAQAEARGLYDVATNARALWHGARGAFVPSTLRMAR